LIVELQGLTRYHQPLSPRSIQPEDFVAAVKPLLAKQDLGGLLQFLKSRWTAEQIVDLLKSRHCDARKVAALALGLVGGACCLGPLSEQLKDPDPVVNEMAEHALWSIWFRSGNCQANHQLAKGAQAMERQDLADAVEHFTRAIEIDPKFAEAYNQRAIAHYLQEHFDESIADCQRTVDLMPCHFGAWAGLGHCHAHEGRFGEALKCYRKALSINPHLECLEEACDELRGKADQ
jgi:tetratricopeptide (TPR) repeat protein